MRKALAILTAAGALAAFALPASADCSGMHSAQSAQSTPVDVANADQATTKTTTQQSQASTGTSN